MREMHTESTADATAHRLTAAAASLTATSADGGVGGGPACTGWGLTQHVHALGKSWTLSYKDRRTLTCEAQKSLFRYIPSEMQTSVQHTLAHKMFTTALLILV